MGEVLGQEIQYLNSMGLLLVEVPTCLLRSLGSDHIFLVGLQRATFYKGDRLLRQFKYEQGMAGGKRRTFSLVDTNPISVKNMLLGLETTDRVDQSFVKVHFHKMIIEYSNWLIDKIVDKEVERIAMREQFLKDNRERLDKDNYECKRRYNDDKVPITEEIKDQQKKKRLKTK